MKLVIVDDIAINRKLLRVTLEAEGHTTFEAADGIEALQILASEKVDGVISDILMPRMDGYRLCNEIRARRHLRDLPFVFYTSTFVSPPDEQMARSVGADKYLTKPVPVQTLLAALAEANATQHDPPQPGAVREIEVLKVYSDRLVTKLEEKNIELERQLRLSALSIDVGAALMHGKTLPETLQLCCDALVRHVDAASAIIWTHNPRDNALELQAGAGIQLPPDRVRIERIAEERKPVHVDLSTEGSVCDGLAVFAGYPLIVGKRLLGVMAIFAREAFSAPALDKIASIADAVALGVERKRAEEELRGALAEKTTLLQEVHHRVKNNLQVICSLLSMQIECSEVDLSSGPLNDAHSRVLAVSLVHEQIYQSETLADLDFGEYIERLSNSVYNASCIDPLRIEMELNVEAIRLGVDHAVPCGLILNELLSNSLKHAFKGGRRGLIRVSVRQTGGGRVELTVADNGVGFPADFRWDEGRSLGLKVVRTLVKQLRGDFSVSGEGGTTFRFNWRLPEAELNRMAVGQATVSSSSKQTATLPHSPDAIKV